MTITTARGLHRRYVEIFGEDAILTAKRLNAAFHAWGGSRYEDDGEPFLLWFWNDGLGRDLREPPTALSARLLGIRGGASRSPAKAAASRANGALGGRPAKRR